MKIASALRAAAAASAVLAALSAYALDPGSWNGTIPGVGLKLVVNIAPDSSVTLDSPDQGAKGIPCVVNYLEGDSIAVSVPQIGMRLTGRRVAPDKLIAKFMQGALAVDMEFKPGMAAYDRPQTPVPPFPYETRDISFIGGDGNTMAATACLPEKADRAVVFISGSGPQNRDEELWEHKPFAVIADFLARKGIASLRFDDRGFGKSAGNFAAATTADFANDARGAIDAIRFLGRFKKVGVIGHSEGARIAWTLAPEVDFIVAIGGPAISGRDILLEQNELILAAKGLSSDVVSVYLDCLAQCFDGRQPDPAPSLPAELAKNLAGVQAQLAASPWLKYFVADNPADDIRAIRKPALALYGEKDIQVTSTSNAPVVRELNPAIEVMVLPGLNHMMQPCSTGMVEEYPQISVTVAPVALEAIADFILKR